MQPLERGGRPLIGSCDSCGLIMTVVDGDAIALANKAVEPEGEDEYFAPWD